MYERLLAEYESGVTRSAEAIPANPAADLAVSPADQPYLAATLPVMSLACGAVAAYAVAANRLRRALGLEPQRHTLRPDRIAAAFCGEALLRIDDQPVAGFAELSGFFPTCDGMIRSHANYPHHRQRLLQTLDLPIDTGRDAAGARIATLRAADIEDRAAELGAIVARVRTEAEWTHSDAGRAAAQGPIVGLTRRDDTGPAGLVGTATSAQPLRGVRVLDLTRVLAGPVATRCLALLGADVLRVDPPWLPEIVWQHIDTGEGKRSTLLDLRANPDTARALLADADVLVTGYRPDAAVVAELDAAAVRPGIVTGRISAWGERGPWARRRGFDSIVQAASGISLLEGSPGALPAQALDHASGYLLAAGIIDALALRARDGVGREARVALARTASWLLAAPGRDRGHPPAALPGPQTTVRCGNRLAARPATAEYAEFPWPAHAYGTDYPAFESR